jgi:hypothetical protein
MFQLVALNLFSISSEYSKKQGSNLLALLGKARASVSGKNQEAADKAHPGKIVEAEQG